MNILQDRASAVSAAHEQARARLSAIEARIADALSREQAALLAADLDAASAAHAEVDAAKSELPSAQAAVESLGAAAVTLAEQVREAQHRDERQQLEDAIAGTRLELGSLIAEAAIAAATATDAVQRAVGIEGSYLQMQAQLDSLRIALGEIEPNKYPPRDRPVSAALQAAPVLATLAGIR